MKERSFYDKASAVLIFFLYIYVWCVSILFTVTPEKITGMCFGFFVIHTISYYDIKGFVNSLPLSTFILVLIIATAATFKKINMELSDIIPMEQLFSLIGLTSFMLMCVILRLLRGRVQYFKEITPYSVAYASILPLSFIILMIDGAYGWRHLMSFTFFIVIPFFIRDFVHLKYTSVKAFVKRAVSKPSVQLGLLGLLVITGYIAYQLLHPAYAMGNSGQNAWSFVQLFKWWVGWQVFDAAASEVRGRIFTPPADGVPPAPIQGPSLPNPPSGAQAPNMPAPAPTGYSGTPRRVVATAAAPQPHPSKLYPNIPTAQNKP